MSANKSPFPTDCRFDWQSDPKNATVTAALDGPRSAAYSTKVAP